MLNLKPTVIVIFGATGDLTARKLIPALFHLRREKFAPDKFRVIGFARRDKSDEVFRDELKAWIVKPNDQSCLDEWNAFAPLIQYHRSDMNEPDGYTRLLARLNALDAELGCACNRIYYLATAPEYFAVAVESLSAAGLISDPLDMSRDTRVVIEKPFGTNLDSACELNALVRRHLAESQIYRIDHYLGKETVQNILSFRFGNEIFEPLFNSQHVSHVQLTVAETLGMEGRRGAYYDQAGTLRDMVQNHILQLFCLIAMEPPPALDAESIHNEKVKVLRSLTPITGSDVKEFTVRGQYQAAEMNGERVKGYLEEEGVNPQSQTETFVALKLYLENWRWAGVPFFLRSGKRLKKRVSEVAIQFKRPPLHLFTARGMSGMTCDLSQSRPNTLIFRIQPDEGISLAFAAKLPGLETRLQTVQMDFLYGQSFKERLPEAYERLLLDALRGDSTLYTRSDEVEQAWRFIDPILKFWAEHNEPAVQPYPAGGWGPQASARLFRRFTGAGWREP